MSYRIATIQRHNVLEDWRRFGTVTVNHAITIIRFFTIMFLGKKLKIGKYHWPSHLL